MDVQSHLAHPTLRNRVCTQAAIGMRVAAMVGILAIQSQAQQVSGSKAASPLAGKTYVEGELIVKFAPGTSESTKQTTRARLSWTSRQKFSLIGAELVSISGLSMKDALNLASREPGIVYAEPNFVLQADIIPNDPNFPQLWGMNNTGQTGGTPDADIDAAEAWNISTGGTVVVGVIDTGVDTLHPDLRGNIWTNPGEIPGNFVDDDANGFIDDVNGWDFVNNDNGPLDDAGHGTHVSGTITARGNNGIGVAGVCWSARIMALKFLDAGGSGSTSGAIQAVEYATRMGARLTSNSWGGGGYSQALKDAIDSSGAHGMLFVAAAGNARSDNDLFPSYPSGYDLNNIIAVAATDDDDHLANEPSWGSNFGATTVDLGAPGVNVLSSIPGGGYATYSGTSMATPHVSGVAALIWSQYPLLTNLQVKARIMGMADPVPDLAGRCVTGARLNAFMSLAEPDSTPPSAVANLAVTRTEGTRITLSWTSPGDDASSGTASEYDLRYSQSPIDSASFETATQATGEPVPLPGGSTEVFVVRQLTFNTKYYFALKAADEWSNPSELSNTTSGTTVGPPVAQLSPDSLKDSLFTNGISTQELHLANSGEGELFFGVEVDYPSLTRARGTIQIPPPATPLNGEAKLGSGSARTTSKVPYDITGEWISRAGLKVLLVYADDGATVLSDILRSYPDIAVVDTWPAASALSGTIPPLSVLLGYDVVIAWNNYSWADIYAIGNVLADYIDAGGAVVTAVDCWSSGAYASHGRYFDSAGYCPFRSLGSALFNARTLGTFDGSHPIMDGVTALGTAAFYNATALTDGAQNVALWDDGTPLVATNPRTAAINIWPGDGYYWTGDFPTLIHNAVNFVGGAGRWLTIVPGEGEVAPSGDSILNARMNAANLDPGDYNATILVHANDPGDSVFIVPVQLHITGAPDVAVKPDSIDFGIVYVGYPETLPLQVANPGPETLAVTSLTANLADISVDIAGFVLPPGRDTVVSVQFSPTLAGDVSGSLSILSNDPDEPTLTVPVRASGLHPPVIAVSPDSLSDSLFTGESSVRLLSVSNTGASDLSFDLSVSEAPGLVLMRTKQSLPHHPAPSTTGPTNTFPTSTPSTQPYHQGQTPLRGSLPAGDVKVSSLSASGIRILLLYSGGDPSEIRGLLQGFDDIAAVDLFDAIGAAPTLGQLSPYDVVMVANGNSFGDPTGLGNVLADFADAGGGVVITVASFASGYEIQGRFLTGGYMPFNIGTGPAGGASLGSFNASHPIMAGVTAAFGDVLADVTLSSGSELVAEWNNGFPFVATKGTNVAAVNVFVAVGGYWTGDIPLLLHNAAYWSSHAVRWLSANATSATLPPGTSADIEMTFDAFKLNGGNYRANIVIESNDPSDSMVTVPASLHVTGAPDLSLSDTAFNWGLQFIGAHIPETLKVSNVGTDLLTVSGITSDEADYSVNVSGFSLNPGASQKVVIVFAPGSTGPIPGTLTISSDDPDEPTLVVVLQGEGVEPPVFSVSPDSLRDSLFTGDTSLHVLTISNSGVADLEWSIETQEVSSALSTYQLPAKAPPESDMGSAPLAGAPFTASAECRSAKGGPIAPLVAPLKDLSGKMIAIGSGSYSTIWADLEARGAKLRFPTFPMPQLLLDSLDVLALDDVVNGLSPSDVTQIRAWVQHGGGLLLQGDESMAINNALLGGAGLSETSLGTCNYAVFTDILPHPTTEGVDTVNGASYCAYYSAASPAETIVRDDFARTHVGVSRLGTGRVMAAANEIFDDFNLTEGDTRLFGNQAFDWLAGSVRWLTVAPRSGKTPAGSTDEVDVHVDADGLFGGDYLANIVISNNDPLHSTDSVPVRLHVTGVPDIAVSPPALNFGTRFIGASIPETLWVSNPGTDLLAVSGIASDQADYSVDGTGFNLNPVGKQAVVVTFAPSTTGTISGILTITSNDPDESIVSVALSGQGLEPPVISVAPDSLGDSLFTGEQRAQSLTIANTGANDLVFSIRSQASPYLSRTGTAVLDRPNRNRGPMPADNAVASPAATPTTQWAPMAPAPSKEVDALQAADFLIIDHGMEKGFFYRYNCVTTSEQMFRTLTVPDLEQYNVVYFEPGWTSYSNLTDNMAALADYVRHGGVAVINIASNIGDGFGIDPMGTNYSRATVHEAESILDPAHPYITGLPFGGPTLNVSSFSTWGSTDHGTLTGLSVASHALLQNTDGVSWIEYAFGSGAVIVTTLTYGWGSGGARSDPLRNLIDYSQYLGTTSGVRWLSFAPDVDTVPAGEQVEVAVTFNAAGLFGGDYVADIIIENNDPIHPEVGLPAFLHVTGAPDVALSDSVLDYGFRFLGAVVPETLVVSNKGTDLLSVTNISSNHGDFSADASAFILNPGEARNVVVTFAPSATGSVTGALTISSNDPDEPTAVVTLKGTGAEPPVIAVSPGSLSDTLFEGESSTHTLTIANHGHSNLVISLSFDETSAASGVLTVPEALRSLAGRNALDGGIEIGSGQALSGGLEGRTPPWASLVNHEGAAPPRAREATRTMPSPSTASAGPDVAVLAADDGFYISDVISKLAATGQFGSINSIDVRYVTPTLAELRAFDAVLVWGDFAFDDAVALGDTLAAYVDGGGGVVCAVFEVGGGFYSALGGRWALQEYNVMVRSTYAYGYYQSLGAVAVPAHPIMAGVNTFDGGYASFRPSNTGLTTGSTLIASWTDGMPLVATKLIGTVHRVDLGFFPPSSDVYPDLWNSSTDGDLLLANALSWVAVPVWVSTPTVADTIPAGSIAHIDIVFNSTNLSAGDYDADIVISSNDPLSPQVIVPAHLHNLESILGDFNGNGLVDIADIIYLVNFIFKGGPEPRGLGGDVSCDGGVTLADLITMVNFVFKSGTLGPCP